MRICELSVSNYRNLNIQSIKLNESISYIVGENNLGKSNFLHLIDTVCNGKCFDYDDFGDPASPITVSVVFELSDAERAKVSKYCTPNESRVFITVLQESPDETFIIKDSSGNDVKAEMLRCANYQLYETVATDVKQLEFSRNRGVGKIFARELTAIMQRQGFALDDFYNVDKLQELARLLSAPVGNIPFADKFGLHVGVNTSSTSVLGSVLTLVDGSEHALGVAGSGVQFVIFAVLQILSQITALSPTRREKATSEINSRKIINCILAYDEPEIHLHPYMQRMLMHTLLDIASGKNAGFNTLLKELCDIDAISAQLIVVTHSPNIISPDYESIIRFGTNSQGGTEIHSGMDLTLDKKSRERLIDCFPLVSEAFFARKVILVEGPSERYSIPGFAKTLGYDLDAYGAVVVHASGNGSIPALATLLRSYGIETYSITDRDDGKSSQSCSEENPRDMVTTHRDFEDEIVHTLCDTSNEKVFLQYMNACDGTKMATVDVDALISANKKLKLVKDAVIVNKFRIDGSTIANANSQMRVLAMYKWLSNHKGVELAPIIGRLTPAECVPECYAKLIRLACKW